MFVGLNPSTADETENDATIRKCMGFAKGWGFGGVSMVNLYSFCSRHPGDLLTIADPVNDWNRTALAYQASKSSLVIAAWGTLHKQWRAPLKWDETIEATKAAIGKPMECLKFTKDSNPWHPLYVPYSVERQQFWTPSPKENEHV